MRIDVSLDWSCARQSEAVKHRSRLQTECALQPKQNQAAKSMTTLSSTVENAKHYIENGH
jgi:hypothetical protein